jgi:hypothetical protein
MQEFEEESEEDSIDDPGTSLTWALDDASSAYEDAFRQFWGLDGEKCPAWLQHDTWLTYLRLQELARTLAGAAARLIRPASIPSNDVREPNWIATEAALDIARIREFIDAVFEYPELESRVRDLVSAAQAVPESSIAKKAFFDACMELQAESLFGAASSALGARLVLLLDYLVTDANEFTRHYLARVAECYIRGMPSECAVMCRAVLDVALQSVLDDRLVVSTLRLPPRSFVNLNRRIAT